MHGGCNLPLLPAGTPTVTQKLIVTESNKQTGVIETKICREIDVDLSLMFRAQRKIFLMQTRDQIRWGRNLLTASV